MCDIRQLRVALLLSFVVLVCGVSCSSRSSRSLHGTDVTGEGLQEGRDGSDAVDDSVEPVDSAGDSGIGHDVDVVLECDTGCWDVGDGLLDAELAVDEPGVEALISVEVLATRSKSLNGLTWTYDLLRLTPEGGVPVYAQWFPPPAGIGPRPAVLVTRPYDGISWSGEEVDLKWSSRGGGSWPDDEEPSYGQGSSNIGYYETTDDKAADEAIIYAFHKIGALFVYGRYYAGGSITNDVDDMTAGLLFLGSRADVDSTAIGVFGASWGGFEAVYAAAYAPAGLVPRVGYVLAPLTLMDKQMSYLLNTLPSEVSEPGKLAEYLTFFEPYMRRIRASTGGDPGFAGADYSFWDADALVARTATLFVLVHDQWDTLVPFEESETLAGQAPDVFRPFFLFQDSEPDYTGLPLSHGPMLAEGFSGPAIYTFYYTFMFGNLIPETEFVYAIYEPSAMRAFFEAAKRYKEMGYDVSWVPERLVEVARPNVMMLDATVENHVVPGAEFLAGELKAVWGFEVAPEDVSDFVAQGLP